MHRGYSLLRPGGFIYVSRRAYGTSNPTKSIGVTAPFYSLKGVGVMFTVAHRSGGGGVAPYFPQTGVEKPQKDAINSTTALQRKARWILC